MEANDALTPMPSPQEGPSISPRKPRILVVDDEPGYRTLLQWELGHQGMEVETAANGTEAVQLARKMKFDVVITDLTMPQVDGFSVLEEIKRASPQTAVIIATGFGTVEAAVSAMQKGASDFVLKPFDLEILFARIGDALNRLSQCTQCPFYVAYQEKKNDKKVA